MKNGTAIVIVLLLLIILGMGGFAFYLWQNQNKQSLRPGGLKNPNDLTDLLLENQDAGWQEYSSLIGYSLKYPSKYFTVKNENANADLYNHVIKDPSTTLAAGTIYVKRQVTNITDLEKIYQLIEDNLKKTDDNSGLITASLKGKKSLVLEDGKEVLEFDQSGVDEYHNIILLNGGYLYNLGYKSNGADSLLINYFNKMYPTIRFTNSGAREGWKQQAATSLGFTLSIPPGWVWQEASYETVAIVSPNENTLTFAGQKSLSLDNQGKRVVITASSKIVEVILPLDKDNSPVANSKGIGQVQGTALYLDLDFKGKSDNMRKTDWETMQEIIKTLTLKS